MASMRQLPDWFWRSLIAGSLFAAGIAWTMHRQFGVDEVHLADSPRNFPLAISPPTAEDWPRLFGASGANVAGGNRFPQEITQSGPAFWQVELPGTGQGAPCVWRELVVVPIVDPQRRTISLAAVNRHDGRRVWQTDLHREVRLEAGSPQGYAAPACDGQSIFLGAAVEGRLVLSAVDLQGRLRFRRDLGPMNCRTGRLVSPVLDESLVIVAGDHRGMNWNRWNSTGHLSGVHRLTGEIIWRVRRPNHENLAIPAVANVAGRKQLLVPGPEEIASYDPATGSLLWTCRWNAGPLANTVAWNDELVFAMTGHPQPLVMAVRGDGSGDVTATHVAWQSSVAASSLISPLHAAGSVLCLSDAGLLTSLDDKTGKTQWRRPLSGTFTTPPLRAGGELWCLNTQGKGVLIDPNQRGTIVAEQILAAGSRVPPAATRRQLILRTSTGLLSHAWDDSDPPVANTAGGSKKRL